MTAHTDADADTKSDDKTDTDTAFGSDTDTDPGSPRRAVAMVTVAVGALCVVIIRWLLTADRVIFHLAPDEPSQLAVARWLAGGTRWNMFDHATWQPGLAVLVAPFYWLTDDGESVVRAALALNVVLGGIGAALLAAVLRRMTDVSWLESTAISVVVATAPSSVSASSYVWAEPLVTVSFLVVIGVTLRFHRTHGVGAAGAAILASVVAYACHSRLLPLVASAVVLTVGWDLWSRRWKRAAALGGWAVGLLALSAEWKSWILRNVWDDPSNQNTVGAVWRRAQHPVDVGDALLGQVWYQVVATVGMAAIGTAAIVVSLRTSQPADRTVTTPAVIADPGPVDPGPFDPGPIEHDPIEHEAIEADRADPTRVDRGRVDPGAAGRLDADPDPAIVPRSSLRLLEPVPARILVVATLPQVLLAAVFMSDRPRADQFIYGRYNDAVVWPVVALGLVWIVRRMRDGFDRRDLVLAAVVAATMVAGGFGIDRLHGDELREDFGVRAMIAGLLPYVEHERSLDVWRATVIGALLFTAAVATLAIAGRAKAGRAPILAVSLAIGVGILAIALDRTDSVLDARLNGWTRSEPVTEVESLVPPGVALAVKTVASSEDPAVSFTTQRQRYLVYQFYLPDRQFLRDRGVDDAVGPYVFAPLGDPELVDAGAELIWTDPSTHIGLWREPAGEQPEGSATSASATRRAGPARTTHDDQRADELTVAATM